MDFLQPILVFLIQQLGWRLPIEAETGRSFPVALNGCRIRGNYLPAHHNLSLTWLLSSLPVPLHVIPVGWVIKGVSNNRGTYMTDPHIPQVLVHVDDRRCALIPCSIRSPLHRMRRWQACQVDSVLLKGCPPCVHCAETRKMGVIQSIAKNQNPSVSQIILQICITERPCFIPD